MVLCSTFDSYMTSKCVHSCLGKNRNGTFWEGRAMAQAFRRQPLTAEA
jgi:hypothetical protein